MSNGEFRCLMHRVKAEQSQAAALAADVLGALAPHAGLIK